MKTLQERLLESMKQRNQGEVNPYELVCPECSQLLRETGKVSPDGIEYGCSAHNFNVWVTNEDPRKDYDPEIIDWKDEEQVIDRINQAEREDVE